MLRSHALLVLVILVFVRLVCSIRNCLANCWVCKASSDMRNWQTSSYVWCLENFLNTESHEQALKIIKTAKLCDSLVITVLSVRLPCRTFFPNNMVFLWTQDMSVSNTELWQAAVPTSWISKALMFYGEFSFEGNAWTTWFFIWSRPNCTSQLSSCGNLFEGHHMLKPDSIFVNTPFQPLLHFECLSLQTPFP